PRPGVPPDQMGTASSSRTTLPPGKAWKPPKNRSASERRTTKTSAALGPRANSTLAAWVIALTPSNPPSPLTPLPPGERGKGPLGPTRGLGLLLIFVFRLRPGLAGQPALDALEQPFHGEGLADVVNDAEVFGVGLVARA